MALLREAEGEAEGDPGSLEWARLGLVRTSLTFPKYFSL